MRGLETGSGEAIHGLRGSGIVSSDASGLSEGETSGPRAHPSSRLGRPDRQVSLVPWRWCGSDRATVVGRQIDA